MAVQAGNPTARRIRNPFVRKIEGMILSNHEVQLSRSCYRRRAIPIATRITVFLALILGGSIHAATVSGRITDPQGKTVAGAKVHLARLDDSPVTETQTDGVGQYSI